MRLVGTTGCIMESFKSAVPVIYLNQTTSTNTYTWSRWDLWSNILWVVLPLVVESVVVLHLFSVLSDSRCEQAFSSKIIRLVKLVEMDFDTVEWAISFPRRVKEDKDLGKISPNSVLNVPLSQSLLDTFGSRKKTKRDVALDVFVWKTNTNFYVANIFRAKEDK